MSEYTTSIDIDAPPDVVFDYLTVPGRMTQWLGQHAELEPLAGGRFAVDIGGYAVRGEYQSVEPQRRVVVSWGFAGSIDLPPASSTVEFTLTVIASGTRLDLRHSDLPDQRLPSHAAGWAHYLGRLADRLRGLDLPEDAWPAPLSAGQTHLDASAGS